MESIEGYKKVVIPGAGEGYVTRVEDARLQFSVSGGQYRYAFLDLASTNFGRFVSTERPLRSEIDKYGVSFSNKTLSVPSENASEFIQSMAKLALGKSVKSRFYLTLAERFAAVTPDFDQSFFETLEIPEEFHVSPEKIKVECTKEEDTYSFIVTGFPLDIWQRKFISLKDMRERLSEYAVTTSLNRAEGQAMIQFNVAVAHDFFVQVLRPQSALELIQMLARALVESHADFAEIKEKIFPPPMRVVEKLSEIKLAALKIEDGMYVYTIVNFDGITYQNKIAATSSFLNEQITQAKGGCQAKKLSDGKATREGYHYVIQIPIAQAYRFFDGVSGSSRCSRECRDFIRKLREITPAPELEKPKTKKTARSEKAVSKVSGAKRLAGAGAFVFSTVAGGTMTAGAGEHRGEVAGAHP